MPAMPPRKGETVETIPVLAEIARIGKRQVKSVRAILRKTVQSRNEVVETLLKTQDLAIERVPVGRVVATAPPVREEGDVLIIPVLEEELVVEKRLVLREEIHVRRTETTRPEQTAVRLRREEVSIERTDPRPTSPQESHVMATTPTSGTPTSGATTTESYSGPGTSAPGTGASDTHHIVAMFETYEQARAARDKLMATAGLSASEVDILDRNAQQGDASFTYERTSEGFWGAIKRLFLPEEDVHGYAEGIERGHAMLVVRPRADQREKVIDVLETCDPVDFDAREQEWRGSGWSGTHAGAGRTGTDAGRTGAVPASSSALGGTTGTTAAGLASSQAGTTGGATTGTAGARSGTTGTGPGTSPGAAGGRATTNTGTAGLGTAGPGTGRDETIPVVEERLQVGKRQVSRGGVRVRSYVVERPVQEQVTLHQEQVGLERHAVDRPAGNLPPDAFRERTIEVTATDEEAVVAKEARVVEEIAVRKEASERTETVNDTVRRTKVEVEDTRPGQPVGIPATKPTTTKKPGA